jgi:glucose/mannose-6-phosphate isomerase
MKKLIENFSSQLEEALSIGNNFKIQKPINPITNIIISGLGGSGIGATLVQEYLSPIIAVPIIVNKDYNIPKFVSKNSLVIISSYSGNTEETLQTLTTAIKAKAIIVCITSGGKIEAIAKKHKIDCVIIPSGMPPRSCLGLSALQQLFVLHKLKLIPSTFVTEIKEAIELINKEELAIIKQAKKIAKTLSNKIPVIYSCAGNEAVAIRFRQQINENGKQLCWHHVIPEMNHNELVGWRERNNDLAVVLFKTNHDYSRSLLRMDLNKIVFKKYTKTIIEITAKGDSFLAQAIYQIHLGDWISYFLSEFRNFDCTEVKIIDWLKGELSKVN